MSRASDISAFCDRLGYQFSNAQHLKEALTHPSFQSDTVSNNQRLEFLGDRVLGLVTAERLLQLDADANEGDLAPRLNAMVRKETCAEIAGEIGLGALMRIGRSEMQSGGRRKTALLGDAMEAVLAAVYLDGGYAAARDVTLRLWGERFATAETTARDAKTALQEWAQARGQKPPRYDEVSRKGPDHAPIFTIRVVLDSGQSAQSSDRSKRAAQQLAAAKLLETLETPA